MRWNRWDTVTVVAVAFVVALALAWWPQ